MRCSTKATASLAANTTMTAQKLLASRLQLSFTRSREVLVGSRARQSRLQVQMRGGTAPERPHAAQCRCALLWGRAPRPRNRTPSTHRPESGPDVVATPAEPLAGHSTRCPDRPCWLCRAGSARCTARHASCFRCNLEPGRGAPRLQVPDPGPGRNSEACMGAAVGPGGLMTRCAAAATSGRGAAAHGGSPHETRHYDLPCVPPHRVPTLRVTARSPAQYRTWQIQPWLRCTETARPADDGRGGSGADQEAIRSPRCGW